MNTRAELRDDQLVLSTGRLRYVARWNEGHLIGLYLEPREGERWELAGTGPDCVFPGEAGPPAEGRLVVAEQAATPRVPAHLRAEVFTRLGALEVKRVFRLFPDCPLIGCRLELRGSPRGPAPGEPVVLHRLQAPHPHLEIECAQFFDRTDDHNNLVQVVTGEPYLQPWRLRGNVLLARDRLADRGLVLLKEAPGSDAQLASPGFDFLCRGPEIQVVGLGLEREDMSPTEWISGYGCAFGATGRDPFALLSALRDYQHRWRVHDPQRDDMLMLNTWGDAGEDRHLDEAFVLGEIEAGARLGITHFQLDHGWETTQSEDQTGPPKLERLWDTPHFWNVHPGRFPHGLAPCVETARRAGLELCLWFNPSPEDSYAHWQDDAQVLIGLHREYGVRTFKIDGVEIPDRRAERNLRRMLEAVLEATDQQAVFNLDLTAGRRFGYFDFTAYGNKFLENRYTDSGSYYPHWTLRNLWTLSRYVSPQTLQIEFLNLWRHPENYPADDPLAPSRVPFDYAFAVTMPAQPLAWFEATGLPPEAFDLAGLVRIYRQHWHAFHAGTVLPIGESPCGTGWTGFQSCGEEGGYFLVFREWNQRPEAALATWTRPGQRVHCRCLAGPGQDFEGEADPEGRLTFRLPRPFAFGLYQYEQAEAREETPRRPRPEPTARLAGTELARPGESLSNSYGG